MPRGDRTGPMSSGPMTGRGMGYCAGFTGQGFVSPGQGYGFGRRGGLGRGLGIGLGLGRAQGWRHFSRFGRYPMPYAPPYAPLEGAQMTPEKEIDHLKEESQFLKEELKQIEQRINTLKGEKE
ncbi:DUF5320 domain-containing protein [Acidobacteriota bacterium]